MKHITFAVIAIGILFGIHTQTTYAYVTTDQNSFTIDGKTKVYTIDFVFGHATHDIHIPVRALQTSATSTKGLSYAIHNTEGNTLTDTSMGIVVSNAPIRDGMYVIKKGEKRSFTLLVIETPQTTSVQSGAKMHVTYLPFNFDGKQSLQLNPSELTSYVTPEMETLK